MASVSISSSPVCSMKLQQQLSSSSLLSSPNTSSSSSTTALSPASSSANPNHTTPPSHYNSHNLHSHHQIQLAQIQQQIAQQQQQSHHANNNNLNTNVNISVPSLTSIKKEPISPAGINSYVTNSTNNNIKSTMLINANCNNNSPSATNVMTNTSANNNVTSSTTAISSNANSNENFCGNNSIINSITNSKCKRKINFSHLGIPNRGHMPATVARRNARERNRVKQVNNGFSALKQHIPLGHRSKKMSKVETLRCAVDYIKNLKSLLDPNGVFTAEEGSSFDQLQFDFGMGSGSAGSTQQLSPTSSEDPSSPSYTSEGSYVASNGQTGNNNNSNNNGLYDYENYEPVSPEDEELLDAISWWQQS